MSYIKHDDTTKTPSDRKTGLQNKASLQKEDFPCRARREPKESPLSSTSLATRSSATRLCLRGTVQHFITLSKQGSPRRYTDDKVSDLFPRARKANGACCVAYLGVQHGIHLCCHILLLHSSGSTGICGRDIFYRRECHSEAPCHCSFACFSKESPMASRTR